MTFPLNVATTNLLVTGYNQQFLFGNKMIKERYFQPIFGGVITLTNVIDLDDTTIMGDCAETRGTKIFSKDFEITETQKHMKNVIALTEKKLELLKELHTSLENEGKKYHLKHDDAASNSISTRYSDEQTFHKFLLFDTQTEKCVCYGDKNRIKSWLRTRNVLEKDVILDETPKFGNWTKSN